MATTKFDESVDTVARECIAVRLRLLNRVVTKLYDSALRPVGLKVSQMNILVATAKMGTARSIELSRRMQIDISTLSRNVERMRTRGWLENVPGEDAREQPFRLTSSGRRTLERAIPAWERAQSRARKLLGDAATDMLLEAGGAFGLPSRK
jgi:DNA-binding MarR family transcriptional regulator